ncbi:glycosyltransferase [Hyphobacterium sp. CCMP332]|nr:glycosyltransferase [Hyphobacterium sp. CCMP332]
MSKKVCMLSTGHSVKDDRIFFKEALSLQSAGYEVNMLFLVNSDGFARDMSGKILNPDGHHDFYINDIRVILVKRKSNILDKYLNKIFLSSFQKEIIKTGIDLNADIYHCHEPESLYLGYKICKRLSKGKLVLDAHESWVKLGFKSRYVKNKIIPKLKYLISANQLTRGYLLNLNYGIKSEVIYNAAIFQKDVETKSDNSSTFRIVHEGTLKFNRGLKMMLKGIKILKSKGIDFEWDFLGYIPSKELAFIKQYQKTHKLDQYINLKGNLNYEDLPSALERYNLGIIASIYESNNYLAGPPNKLFNYIAAGIPVLALDIPETSRIIQKYQVGKVLKSASVENFVNEILKLDRDRNLYTENIRTNQHEFIWKAEEKKLLKFYGDYLIS